MGTPLERSDFASDHITCAPQNCSPRRTVSLRAREQTTRQTIDTNVMTGYTQVNLFSKLVSCSMRVVLSCGVFFDKLPGREGVGCSGEMGWYEVACSFWCVGV